MSMQVPFCSIIMGSDSDLPVMSAAAEVMEEFNVSYELAVMSAHRTPEKVESTPAQRCARSVSLSPVPAVPRIWPCSCCLYRTAGHCVPILSKA